MCHSFLTVALLQWCNMVLICHIYFLDFQLKGYLFKDKIYRADKNKMVICNNKN